MVTFFSFVDFSLCFVQLFLLHASYHFHRFPLWFFVPFPLVSCISCIFNIFFCKSFYPSPSVSDRFCTISSGCYRIFPALSLYFSSMFTASSFVPSSRSGFPPCSNRFCTLYSGCYHIFLPGCYHIFLHCIFPAFSSGFCTISSDCYHVFLQFLYPLRGFQSIHAFLSCFSKIFTRLLFPPFPLVCCIFNVFFQEFYPSPSFSDRFCTISSGCYRIFLHFHCLFPTCLLHRHSLFLAVTPVSSMFQQILHGLFLAFSSDRYHVFLKFHCIFQYILFVGFQYVLSSIFLLHVSYHFHLFPPQVFAPFPLVSCVSYLFNININPIVLPDSFIFRSFLHHFLSLLSHFPALSLYFSSMFTASSWFAPSIRCGFLHFPRDFPWFVPSIRSVFVRFPGDFVRFPLIVIMFSCSFIVFSNTSSWSLRPPKRRT